MLNFTDTQKKIVANGLTLLAASFVLAFVGLIGWGVMKFLGIVSAAIIPVVIGLFLSLLFKPYYGWWLKIVRNPTAAVALTLLSVLVPLGFLVYFFGAFVFDQATMFIAKAPDLFARVQNWISVEHPRIASFINFADLPYNEWLSQLSNKTIAVGSGALSYVMRVVSFLVALVFFVYFLMRPTMKGRDYVRPLAFFKPETRDFIAVQIDAFLDILTSFFQRQVVICLIDGFFYALCFWLVGLPYGFIVGFLLGVFNLVPFLGTVLFLPIALCLAAFSSDTSVALVVVVVIVWGLGQLLDGYVLTPKIQGDKTGLGYGGVIFSFFFWGAVFQSFLGLLLAIPLSAFCVVLWRAVKDRYIRPIV